MKYILFILLAFSGIVNATTDVSFAWDLPVDASKVLGYKLCYGNATSIYPTCVDAKNTLAQTITALPDGKYFFAVKAYSANSMESAWSNEVVLTFDTVKPGTPQNLRSVNLKVAVHFKNGKPIVTALIAN